MNGAVLRGHDASRRRGPQHRGHLAQKSTRLADQNDANAIAQLLARRLAAVTAYLVDIKRQYANSDTHLGLMDQVLGNLIAMHPSLTEPGSERSDVPDY